MPPLFAKGRVPAKKDAALSLSEKDRVVMNGLYGKTVALFGNHPSVRLMTSEIS